MLYSKIIYHCTYHCTLLVVTVKLQLLTVEIRALPYMEVDGVAQHH